MVVKHFAFNPFMTNCYVCHDAGEGVLIDPSAATPGEQHAVVNYIEAQHLTVRHLLLTHAHIDHIFGCAFFAERYGLAFQLHPKDEPLLERAKDQAAMFGLEFTSSPAVDTLLAEGDKISFGEVTLRVLHTPGHSPGSVCFYNQHGAAVLSGDVLFQGSIGRTDLWRGSLPELMESIHGKLLSLPDATVIYPGHGPATTIGSERLNNPFLSGAKMPF